MPARGPWLGCRKLRFHDLPGKEVRVGGTRIKGLGWAS
jgi:hypothetical protein